MTRNALVVLLSIIMLLCVAKTSFTQNNTNFKVGDPVEAQDYSGQWVAGTVIAVDPQSTAGRYTVEIDGTGNKLYLPPKGVRARPGQSSSNVNRPSNNSPSSNSSAGQTGMNSSQSTGGNNRTQQQNQGGFGNPQTPTQRNTNGAYPSDINGAWKGTYTCQQGLTNLVLSLSAKSETDVEGIFTFLFGDGPGPVLLGSYKVKGTYDSGNGRIELKGVDWDDKPSGYVLVDLSGTVTTPRRRMAGNVIGPNCTTFQLEKIKF